MSGAARIVVVTGGASGIGEACVRRFVADGDRVVIADRNLVGAQALADELSRLTGVMGASGASGASVDAIAIDLGDEASVAAAARDVEDRIGPVQVLVNCAGVLQRTLPPEELTLKEWDIVARIDLRGTYVSCAAFGGPMAARGRGAIRPGKKSAGGRIPRSLRCGKPAEFQGDASRGTGEAEAAKQEARSNPSVWRRCKNSFPRSCSNKFPRSCSNKGRSPASGYPTPCC
jgi:NAD(P)-dependent dehydrogenase (short-subunit alcohol dehydrogenase family)